MQWEHVLFATGMLVLLQFMILLLCYTQAAAYELVQICQITKDMGYSAVAIAESAIDNFACLPCVDA